MNTRAFKVRSVASAAIVGLALSSASFGLTDAVAQTAGVTSNAAAANNSTITQAEGSLTIHKKGNPDSTGTPTGNVDNSVTGTDLEGVGFTVTPVTGIDLATNAGLAKAANLTVEKARESLGTARGQQFTGTNGQVVFDKLPIGVYLVEETTPKAGYTPAAPFLAFVPMTQNNAGTNQGTSWNYDVHAYPKNYSKPQPTKTVKDVDQNIGGTIEYDIDTVVRKIADGKRLSYYFISDTLDVNNLDVAGAQIAVTVDGTPVAKDSDYELVKDDATGHVLVRFKAEGLKKLTSGAKVKVNVKATKITNGRVVPNSAFEYEPSSPESDQDVKSDTEPPKTPPNENRNETPLVITYFSEVEFKKVDAGRTGLSGAEFQLLRTKAGDKECNASMAAEITEGAKKVQGSLNGGATPVDTFVSDQNGKVNISGLHVTDFADNADVASENQSVYCLYETKAPAGKELLAKPLTFTLMRSGTTTLQRNVTVYETVNGVTSAHTETRDYDALVYEPVALTVGDNNGEVVNLDDTTPNLPLTGGAGVGILAAIGALIVGAGAWFARRSVQS